MKSISFRSLNKKISVSWEVFNPKASTVEIVIKKGNEETEKVTVSANKGMFDYERGIHGELYSVTLVAVCEDGSQGKARTSKRLFLDYDKLPRIPIIKLEMNGEDLKYEEAQKPSNKLLGWSIKNSKYALGAFTMVDDNGIIAESVPMKIRIRGNTSASGLKFPYKIRLDRKIDLIKRGKARPDEEWILLASGADLKTYLGHFIASQCGEGWQPRLRFVNLIVDGDWKGIYVLIESVRKSPWRLNISKRGFIIENDPYWWKTKRGGYVHNSQSDANGSRGVHFKTQRQIYQLGFTFKYPKIRENSDARVRFVRQEIQKIEDLAKQKKEVVFDLIDINSFASWTLAQDILARWDQAGSNMFFSYGHKNEIKNKWKLGPLWDMDGSFSTEHNNKWGSQHAWVGTFTNDLMQMPIFREKYATIWDKVKNELAKNIGKKLDDLRLSEGTEIEESRRLDGKRWGGGRMSLDHEIALRKKWFEQRIIWIDKELQKKEWTTDINRRP